MYDITKTRMLLTMAVLAAVAAVFAGGANARALVDFGSDAAEPAAQPQQGRGTLSADEICAAIDAELFSGVLIDEEAIKAATLRAIQECSRARAAKPTVPALMSWETTPGVSEWAVISGSDVVSRYLNSNRTATSQTQVTQPRPSRFPDGRRSVP